MGTGGIITLVIVGLVVVGLVGFLASGYNRLVELRNRVRNSWSQIDVQLKRRYDLIPNLVETVKGYAKHEEAIYGAFAKARDMYNHASANNDVAGVIEAEQGFSQALGRLLAVKEAYPALMANENFKSLMKTLADTEDKISYSRQFYNDTAMKMNNVIEQFPSNIVASLFGFEIAKYFEITSVAERENVKVVF
ncbi:MAG: LemA family protein [Acholeplasmataceae bacterium]|nr:LemA family protein [Acholeplasmataceae bacterium]